MSKASVSALEAANADQAKKLQIAQNRIRQLETEFDELKRNAVVLPCNVGDTVFAINKNSKRVIPCDVEEIQILRSGEPRISVFYESDNICSDDRECTGCPFSSWHQSPQECDYSCDGEYGGYDLKIEDFGKIVFLTPEAAEAALAERIIDVEEEENA